MMSRRAAWQVKCFQVVGSSCPYNAGRAVPSCQQGCHLYLTAVSPDCRNVVSRLQGYLGALLACVGTAALSLHEPLWTQAVCSVKHAAAHLSQAGHLSALATTCLALKAMGHLRCQ